MCGIVAVRSQRALPPGSFERALDALHHRGPDGRGTYRSIDGQVMLGHTRLAVVAPEHGAQPLTSEDGRVVAVVNGEFYGDDVLRRALEKRGHRFRSGSDSELLVHLYEDYGTSCVHHLRGEFAFVLWDASQQRLVAGRDRFGIKPLVYTEHPLGLLIASEAKGLFALGVTPAWDHHSFEHALTHQYLPAERTLFRGVHHLPPGHLLIAEGEGRPRLERYWDLDMPEDEVAVDAGEAAAMVRETLEEAVRLRLRADVPVAFHLSGGIDSASIIALAARHTTAPIHAFSVSFGYPPYDEAALAQEVADSLGATLHVVEVDQDAIVDALSDAVFYGEGLCINGQLPAKFLLARAIHDHGFKVVLSGEGADEGLLGYAHLGRDLLASRKHGLSAQERSRLDALDPTQLGVMLPQGEVADLVAVREALGFVPTFLAAKGATGVHCMRLLRDDLEPNGLRCAAFVRLLSSLDIAGQLRGRAQVLQSAYLWTRLALTGYILRTLGDGTEMAASVEGRTPFLDHVLFERLRDLPIALKIQDGNEKHVLREAMRGLLPEGVRTRRKHPFLAPPITRFQSSRVREYVLDLLAGAPLSNLPLLDPGKVRRFAERSLRGDPTEQAAAEPVLMTLLSACLIQDRFRMQQGGT